jgi:chorismate mutase
MPVPELIPGGLKEKEKSCLSVVSSAREDKVFKKLYAKIRSGEADPNEQIIFSALVNGVRADGL